MSAAEPAVGRDTRATLTAPAPARTRGPRRVSTPVAFLAVGLAAIASLTSVIVLDRDGATDTVSIARSVGHTLLQLRWPLGAAILALTAGHYLATAIAARAAAGVTLRFGELLRVQFAAAAANRVTPGGIGASALTARYFTRRGLSLPRAAGAVAVLALLGGLADLLVLLLIVALGAWLQLGGGSGEFVHLTRHLRSLLGPVRSPWLWCALAAAVTAGAGIGLTRHRSRLHRAIAGFWAPAREIATHPGRLVVLLAASGATTFIMGLAFVAATQLLPGPMPHAALGAVLVAYMLGAAAGSAVPVPAGLGSTEAALTAVLVGLHVPAAHAVLVVLVYRIITFWLPAALGVLLARGLRRGGAL